METRMGGIKTFRDLLVWQKSMSLVTDIYRQTQSFPSNETYGLVSQMRRCAVSIPSNIAEGFGRRATKEYLRFLQIAMGSLFELETQLEISRNLQYLSTECFETFHGRCRELERMLSALIAGLKRAKEQEN